jgi:hypothetical protein
MSERRSWPRPFFFVHVMKTAGLTLGQHIDANFTPEQRYPTPGDRPIDYMVIVKLREAVVERRDRVRLWRGHFPYFVTGLVPEAVTMTILREPLARTLSQLAQYRIQNAPDKDVEAIYDDPAVSGQLLLNHQTKVFSLSEADNPGTYLKVIDIDGARLASAKDALERVDLLGLQEQFPRFLRVLSDRYNWQIGEIENVNVGVPVRVAESFRRRILEDNAADVELYEHARRLVGP